MVKTAKRSSGRGPRTTHEFLEFTAYQVVTSTFRGEDPERAVEAVVDAGFEEALARSVVQLGARAVVALSRGARPSAAIAALIRDGMPPDDARHLVGAAGAHLERAAHQDRARRGAPGAAPRAGRPRRAPTAPSRSVTRPPAAVLAVVTVDLLTTLAASVAGLGLVHLGSTLPGTASSLVGLGLLLWIVALANALLVYGLTRGQAWARTGQEALAALGIVVGMTRFVLSGLHPTHLLAAAVGVALAVALRTPRASAYLQPRTAPSRRRPVPSRVLSARRGGC